MLISMRFRDWRTQRSRTWRGGSGISCTRNCRGSMRSRCTRRRVRGAPTAANRPGLDFMKYDTHIENPDVVLIGSGIMSANLGAMLKSLEPGLSIQVYEV